MKNSLTRNQSGSTILITLVTIVIIEFIGAMALKSTLDTDKYFKVARIKNNMQEMEFRLRGLLYNSASYSTYNQQTSGNQTGALNESVIASLILEVPGANCTTPPCGITVQKLPGRSSYWNSALSRFEGRIVYNGSEQSLNDVVLRIQIPPEIIQERKFFCPANAPFLRGFRANGDLLCEGLPSSPCEKGFFMSAVDLSLNITCRSLSQLATCDSNSFMTKPSFNPSGTQVWSYSCSPRQSPYDNPGLRPAY